MTSRREVDPKTFESAVARIFRGRTVELTRPEASGRQYIRLVSEDGTMLVLGWANVAEGTAELRTLGHTLIVTKRRFGREIDLVPGDYMRFLETAARVLESASLAITVVAHPAADPEWRLPAATVKHLALPICAAAVAAAWLGLVVTAVQS
jgi:hypothetical protein